MSEPDHPTELAELRRRVVYSLLMPAASFAAQFGLPVKQVAKFVQLSYFRQLRSAGASMEHIGKSMGVSTRTVKRLARKLRETFFLPEVEHGLPRQVEFTLWGQPMTRGRLHQVLDAEDGDIDRALEQLIEEERVGVEEGRPPTFYVVSSVTRLAMRDDWVARVGALNSLMENVTNTVFGRFFSHDPRSFARTLSFRIRERDLDELRAFYEEALIPKLTELEERARDDEVTELQMSVIWSPFGAFSLQGEEDEEAN